jgi:hypothetical protein
MMTAHYKESRLPWFLSCQQQAALKETPADTKIRGESLLSVEYCIDIETCGCQIQHIDVV